MTDLPMMLLGALAVGFLCYAWHLLKVLEGIEEIITKQSDLIRDLLRLHHEHVKTQNKVIEQYKDLLSTLIENAEDEDDEEYSNNNHVVGER